MSLDIIKDWKEALKPYTQRFEHIALRLNPN